MDLTLTINNLVIIPVALIIAFVISYFYYKRSSLEGIQKKLFTALRFISLFFIFVLLASPVVSLVKNSLQTPVHVFLIDNSESLLIEKRDEKLKDILKDRIRNSGPAGSENLYYLFSGNLYREINGNEFDTIRYKDINNFETNLTGSIYSLQAKLANKDLSSITIISDGMINEGGNPSAVARSLNVPVNYILVGDTLQKNDLVIKNVYYNKTAFIESIVPVNVEINSFNYDRNIKLNLYEEDKLIDSKDLKVTNGQIIYNVNLNVTSEAEKIIKYKVEVTGPDDEITLENNFREFFIKFVNNKFKVLVLSGGPSADNAFITGEIKKIKNFEASFFTQKSSTEFYEGAMPDISSFDSYILIGYPTEITNQNILNEIKDKLERNNSSLLFFASRNTDYRKLSVLENKLPFRVTSISGNEEETGIKTVSSLNNEVFRNSNLISSVNTFPNIFKSSSVFSLNSNAETFLVMSKNNEPALVIQNSDKNRSAAFLAYGLYKWRLNNQKNNSEEVLNYLLATSVVAITNKDEKKAFTAETTKPVYSRFEDVKFTAHIMNFELQGGEQIKVKINGTSFSQEIELTKKENKYYEGEINIPGDGDYDYTASLYSKNNFIESIQNRFEVGKNNFEYGLTKADNLILNNLSNDTHGKNFTDYSGNEFKDSLKAMSNKYVSELRSKKNYDLNFNPWYLGILIFLLCFEWFLRKRNSLP